MAPARVKPQTLRFMADIPPAMAIAANNKLRMPCNNSPLCVVAVTNPSPTMMCDTPRMKVIAPPMMLKIPAAVGLQVFIGFSSQYCTCWFAIFNEYRAIFKRDGYNLLIPFVFSIKTKA